MDITTITTELLGYATASQRKKLQAVVECDSVKGAARKLGCDPKTIRDAYKRTCAMAARQGYSPKHDMNKAVPDGYVVKGTSTLYDAEGNAKLQWVKSSIDQQRQVELMRQLVADICADIEPVKPSVEQQQGNDKLMNLYVISDYHFGMLADEDECGADWDIKIAESLLARWFGSAVELSPCAGSATLCFLGDTLHFDSLEAKTPTSGNVLDADSRYYKVVRIAVRAIKRICNLLLERHKQVNLIIATGNHDITSSVWLREMFAALYDAEPRLNVDLRPDGFYCVEHGMTSMFFHHGHRAKFDRLDSVFASKYRDVFGRTKYSYAHCGHLHSQAMKESSLMTVEQHRTLAAHDAYATHSGYQSGRSAVVVTYSSEFGEVSRLTISPEMLK